MREAVAERFGLTAVSVTRLDGTPAGVSATPTPFGSGTALPGSALHLGPPVDLAGLPSAVGFPFRKPAAPALGEPDSAYLLQDGDFDAITFVYADRSGIPVGPAGVAVLVSAFRRGGTGDLVGKGLPDGATGRDIVVINGSGLWIDGEPHSFALVGPAGRALPGTERFAGNTLLWEHDGVTYRIEAMLPLQDVLAIARSMAE